MGDTEQAIDRRSGKGLRYAVGPADTKLLGLSYLSQAEVGDGFHLAQVPASGVYGADLCSPARPQRDDRAHAPERRIGVSGRTRSQ